MSNDWFIPLRRDHESDFMRVLKIAEWLLAESDWRSEEWMAQAQKWQNDWYELSVKTEWLLAEARWERGSE